MICQAKIYTERLNENKTITDKDVIEVEVFNRGGCPFFIECVRAYEHYCINKKREQDTNNDPTTGEQDRKAKWWFKK